MVFIAISFGQNFGYALTSVGLLVQNSTTGQALSLDDLAKVEAWGMKIYNQSPRSFTEFLSYLSGDVYTVSQIKTYITTKFVVDINTGVTAVTAAYGAYSWIVREAQAENPNPIFTRLYNAMLDDAMADPASLTQDGDYVLLKTLLGQDGLAAKIAAGLAVGAGDVTQGIRFDSSGSIILDNDGGLKRTASSSLRTGPWSFFKKTARASCSMPTGPRPLKSTGRT